MFKNMPFRAALAISVSLHLVILSPWSVLRFEKNNDKQNQVEVTYILEEIQREEIEAAIENLPQKYDLEKKELRKSPKGAREAARDARLSEPAEKEDRYVKEEEIKELEEYIAYYELIRQKIKKYVNRHYKKRRAEGGRVDVIFALNKRGRMTNLEIAGIKGRDRAYLGGIAQKSVKSASPFPPFPAALKKDTLTFTISIIFKKG
jgi:TonB family protein